MADEVTMKKSTYNKLLVGFVVVLIAFSFTAGFLFGSAGSTGTVTDREQAVPSPSPTPTQQQPTQAVPSRVSVSLDDDPQLGDKNAPVVMIEFSDFQCPFCRRFFDQTLSQVKTDYIDTGKVLFVYRDFPLDSLHPQATPAAEAAQCANEQGKFWEYHDNIFEEQNKQGSGTVQFSNDDLKEWAADLSLDTTQFNSCLDSGKYSSEVSSDFQDGVNVGVSGTPTIFIGSPESGYQKIVGAQPYSVIKSVIDEELGA